MIREDRTVLELEHRVGGPPDLVFEYFTHSELHSRWHGAQAELDARPGGIYRVDFGPDICVVGTYVIVEPPRRLRITWGFEKSKLDLPKGLTQVPPGSTEVEFTFIPDGDATIIHVRHSGLPTDEARACHAIGWNGYLARLVAIFEQGDPGEYPMFELAAAMYATNPQ